MLFSEYRQKLEEASKEETDKFRDAQEAEYEKLEAQIKKMENELKSVTDPVKKKTLQDKITFAKKRYSEMNESEDKSRKISIVKKGDKYTYIGPIHADMHDGDKPKEFADYDSAKKHAEKHGYTI